MSLLIACILIYNFNMPWWLYPIAMALWGVEAFIKFVSWHK